MKVRAVKATLPQHDGAVVVFSRKVEVSYSSGRHDFQAWSKGKWDAKKQAFIDEDHKSVNYPASQIVEWHYITDRPPRQEKPKPDPLILEPVNDNQEINIPIQVSNKEAHENKSH